MEGTICVTKEKGGGKRAWKEGEGEERRGKRLTLRCPVLPDIPVAF